jgi:hypothetical protein
MLESMVHYKAMNEGELLTALNTVSTHPLREWTKSNLWVLQKYFDKLRENVGKKCFHQKQKKMCFNSASDSLEEPASTELKAYTFFTGEANASLDEVRKSNENFGAHSCKFIILSSFTDHLVLNTCGIKSLCLSDPALTVANGKKRSPCHVGDLSL